MLVSVVIPSYNHRQYVAQAIESVLDQTWPHIDLIVIDDGSKDDSPELIRELHERRGGFRFVARENQGLLKTLNEGLAMAKGEYFCELASDDYFPPESIETRFKFLKENPECVAVFGDGCLLENDQLVATSFIRGKHRRMFEKLNPIPDMLNGVLPVFSTGMIRRQALLKVGGFDDKNFRYYEDLDTPIRLALAGRLGFVDSAVINRREHISNISKTTHHIRLEKVLFFRKLYQDSAFSPYRRLIRKKMAREYLKLGRYLARSEGDIAHEKEMFRNAISCVCWDPRLLWYLLKFNVFRRIQEK